MSQTQSCVVCQGDFTPKRDNQICCSKTCRYERQKERQSSPEGQEYNRKALARYRKTKNGKATRNACARRWKRTAKGKAANRRGKKRYYERKRAQGICTWTGCWEKADGEHVFCCHHLLEMRQQSRDRAKAKRKSKRKATRAKRKVKKVAGMCASASCRRTARPDRTTCAVCARRQSEGDRQRRQKRRTEKTRASGAGELVVMHGLPI